MSDIFGIINTGKVALQTQQTAIGVTGHNIANVNTPGYTRQRVNLAATSTVGIQGVPMGTGVDIIEIQRVYDLFINRQLNAGNQELGTWEGLKTGLETVEIYFNEAGGYGLSEAMTAFWNAWQDLCNNPSGYVERISLLSKSSTLSMTFNELYVNLEKSQDNISGGIEGCLQEVNSMAEQVRNLNRQILQNEVNGQQANDLRDQRDLLIKEISKLIDIETVEDTNGNLNIFVGDGHPLVSGVDAWTLTTKPNPDATSPENIIVWQDKDGSTADINDSISGGKVKGMLDARDVYISDYMARLNDLAENFIIRINTQHANGEDLDGNGGGLFFATPAAGDPAKFMQLVIDDPNLIAASSIGGGAGDNTNAIAIVDLQNQLTMGGDAATFDDFYQSLVSDVGNAVKYASTNYDYQQSIVSHMENYKESISGVSTDDEMVNLVKYQHAYEAAARLINTIDEMLEILLSIA